MKSSGDGYGVKWASEAAGLLWVLGGLGWVGLGWVESRRCIATRAQALLVVVLAQGPAAD